MSSLSASPGCSPTNNVSQPWIYNGIRIVVGGLFLFSGLNQSSNNFQFFLAIAGYDLLPIDLGIAISSYLPCLQIMIGLFLIFDFWAKPSFVISILMLFAFAFAGSIALVRGLSISCGCFGSVSPQLTVGHVVLTLVFAVASVYAWRLAN